MDDHRLQTVQAEHGDAQEGAVLGAGADSQQDTRRGHDLGVAEAGMILDTFERGLCNFIVPRDKSELFRFSTS